jgi:hypothetical protein
VLSKPHLFSFGCIVSMWGTPALGACVLGDEMRR